jgi:hypothetical protein
MTNVRKLQHLRLRIFFGKIYFIKANPNDEVLPIGSVIHSTQ